MADIRTTPLLDDCQRANENPLSFGGRWAVTDYGLWPAPMSLSNNTISPAARGTMNYYWTPEWFSGDVEVWGLNVDVPDLTEGYRLSLLKELGGSLQVDGYQLFVNFTIGNIASWEIRRYTNGVRTDLAGASGDRPTTSAPILFRLVGGVLEGWMAVDVGGTIWNKMVSVADAMYTGQFYASLGIDSDDGTGPGWGGFGAGRTTTPWMPQYIRRTRRRGYR